MTAITEHRRLQAQGCAIRAALATAYGWPQEPVSQAHSVEATAHDIATHSKPSSTQEADK